jgi:CheY-like chemotaxis protein/HPt (histidine-containing phosphotransfer) domain-containing protein
VLVVDDNPVNLTVAQAMLRRLGYECLLASGGLEGAHLLAQRLAEQAADAALAPLVAVLMDLHMPGVDGLQATQLIVSRHGRAAPPVIPMTASAIEDDRARCVEAGMTGFLLKPMLPEDLAKALKQWAWQADGNGHYGAMAPDTGGESGWQDSSNSGWYGASASDANWTYSGFGPDNGATEKSKLSPYSPHPWVDLSRLAAFQEYDDEEHSVTRGVLAAYLADTPVRLATMDAALASSDADTLYKAVHALKGSAGNVGAVAIERICATLETELAAGRVPADMDVTISRLREFQIITAEVLEKQQ